MNFFTAAIFPGILLPASSCECLGEYAVLAPEQRTKSFSLWLSKQCLLGQRKRSRRLRGRFWRFWKQRGMARKKRNSIDSRIEEMVTTYFTISKAFISAAERMTERLAPKDDTAGGTREGVHRQFMKNRIGWLAQHRSCMNMLKDADSSFEREREISRTARNDRGEHYGARRETS